MSRLLPLLTIAILACLFGCGTRAQVGGPTQVDGLQVASVLGSVTDAVQDPARLSKLFVTPPDAATLAKYKDFLYYANGNPTVTGNSAKIKMKIEKPAGTTVGEPEWELEKMGEVWKIKSAPLP